MRRWTPLCAALLILASAAASTAHAGQGVNLRWTSCFGDGGAFNRNFACNSNTGFSALVGSFVLGQSRAQVSGTEMTIDLAASSAALPSWWALWNLGTCRQTAMGINAVISPTAVNCVDWANEQALPAIASYTVGVNGPATARIQMASGVSQASIQDLFAGEEYFTFHLTISNAKTVGSGACAGCSVPVCFRLASIKLVSPVQASNVVLSGATNGTDSNLATWQGGSTSCLAATPVRRQTWGAVKSLYR